MDEHHSPSPKLLKLPNELVQGIAALLSKKDTIALSSTCHPLRESLARMVWYRVKVLGNTRKILRWFQTFLSSDKHHGTFRFIKEAAVSFGDQGPIGCHGPFPFHAGKDGREQLSMTFAESIQAMVSLESLSLDITSLCRNHLEALLSELRVMPSLKLQRLKLGSLKNCEAFVEYAGTNLKTLYLPSMICFRGQFEHLEDLYIHMSNFNNPMLETTNIARAFPRLKSLGFLEGLCAEPYRYSRLDPCQGCVNRCKKLGQALQEKLPNLERYVHSLRCPFVDDRDIPVLVRSHHLSRFRNIFRLIRAKHPALKELVILISYGYLLRWEHNTDQVTVEKRAVNDSSAFGFTQIIRESQVVHRDSRTLTKIREDER
ncbi:uncharacterized protein B0J16DRAFT_395395 [Fusarium flagelliforme]|uniref:uncharacterized protein n=1 Tax=Fusarium flagelliforme TaxID=2675880 RepID=UPI001E8E50AA|nr:uncharacterized protein B0J16DRAFT_395395 [Fusarium flagelliforme]KAH7193479.1 hypothetical protein B0J16DRAFT_395395 [Fusarium flagelliforme]